MSPLCSYVPTVLLCPHCALMSPLCSYVPTVLLCPHCALMSPLCSYVPTVLLCPHCALMSPLCSYVPTVLLCPHCALMSPLCSYVPTVLLCPHCALMSPLCSYVPTVLLCPHCALMSPLCSYVPTGAANVGKSAFICALLDEMASRDIMAAAARRRRPVASAMPGTTLGPICLKAFSGGGDLYDTPGVHLHHRMAAMLHPWDLHHLGPKRRLRSFVVTGPLEQHTGAGKGREKTEEKAEKAERGEKGEKGEQKESVEEAGGEARAEEGTSGEQKGLQGTSLFWGGLVRIDVVKAPAGTALTFFGPVAIRVSTVPTPAANAFYEVCSISPSLASSALSYPRLPHVLCASHVWLTWQAEVGRLLVPPSKPLEEPAWEGLPSQRAFSFRLPAKRSSPVADIAISGLGWVSLSGVKPRQRTNPDADVSSSDATTSSHAGHVEPTGSWDDPDAANDARGGITRFEGPGNQTLGMGYNDEDGHGSSGLFGKQESDVEVVVHVPKGIEVFVRPPMPVGWFANDWYQYEELSEKEEMSRPRVFHDEA
ncbi:unnamed protein product [Closterium sp. NIES-65]|nr:unnamed protein product [Closterium sp. NIES-65]